ncbi:MAG: DUF2934 domain-containing protein [Phycisphaerae bacterium]
MTQTRGAAASRRRAQPETVARSTAATPADGRFTAVAGTRPRQATFGRSAPSKKEIRDRAYFIYLARGGANGDSISDWLQAERELREERRSAAASRRF